MAEQSRNASLQVLARRDRSKRIAPSIMLSEVHGKASSIETPLNQALLSTDIPVSEAPDFLRHRITLITGGLEGDDKENLCKRLLKIVQCEETTYTSSLSVYLSISLIVNSKLKQKLMGELLNCKVEIDEQKIDEFITENPALEDAQIDDISMYLKLTAAHYIYAYAMTSAMMGKQLTSNNYPFWMRRRKATYAPPLGLNPEDDLLPQIDMSAAFASDLYATIKMYPSIRRLLFLNILALAQKENLLAKGLEITVNLLRYSEMSNFLLITNWITILNPDLWAWNELGKYLPYITAAQEKFDSLGQLGPWGKLILPPPQVTEFSAQKLNVPFTIAKRISIEYGNSSLERLAGDLMSANIKHIVDHAMFIVKLAGGSKTCDTMAVRAWRYNGYKNPQLESALDTGAFFAEVSENEERETQRAIE